MQPWKGEVHTLTQGPHSQTLGRAVPCPCPLCQPSVTAHSLGIENWGNLFDSNRVREKEGAKRAGLLCSHSSTCHCLGCFVPWSLKQSISCVLLLVLILTESWFQKGRLLPSLFPGRHLLTLHISAHSFTHPSFCYFWVSYYPRHGG